MILLKLKEILQKYDTKMALKKPQKRKENQQPERKNDKTRRKLGTNDNTPNPLE